MLNYQGVISCIAIMAKPIEMVDLPKNIQDGDFPWLCMCIYIYMILVGGLEHEFYDFPFSWECHRPN